VTQTAQTWALVGATLGAVVITFIGTGYLQRRQGARDDRIRQEQSARDARTRLEHALSEVLAAVQDLMVGVRVVRQAHARRTLPRYYIRAAAALMRALPELKNRRVLTELDTIKPLLGAALDLDHDQMEANRMIALDLATVVMPKANRYLALAARLTLGDDKEITAAMRQLTPKVTELVEATGAQRRKAERVSTELEEALVEFRAFADKRLGNS